MKNKNKLYVCLFLGSCLLLLTSFLFFFSQSQKKLPHQKKINQFLDSLTYSALPDINRDDFYLELDFEYGIWTMKNFFSYDQEGRLVNFTNRQGTCVQLSQITYDFIKPLMENEYRIFFIKGNDDLFFRSDFGIGPTHYFLKLVPKKDSQKKPLVIDPSYKRYGHLKEFQDYNFAEKMESIDLLADKTVNLTSWVEVSYPILLLEESMQMLSLSVKKVNGKYNPDNYALAVLFTEKQEELSYVLFTFVMQDGEFLAVRNKELIAKVLSQKKQEKIINTAFNLFNKIKTGK